MTTLFSRTRLATAAAVLGLALAGCAGPADSGATDDEGLPTAEDLGAEDGGDASGGGAVTSGMCAEDEPDCQDTIVTDDGGAATSSCLAGDEDCTDESFGGQDVTRPVPLTDEIAPGEDLTPAARGATSGASGRMVEQATLVDADTVRLAVIGNPCMLVEDVLVIESPAEVRVLVLAGQDAAVEACDDGGMWWTVDVDLDSPLGDRALLDLAG